MHVGAKLGLVLNNLKSCFKSLILFYEWRFGWCLSMVQHPKNVFRLFPSVQQVSICFSLSLEVDFVPRIRRSVPRKCTRTTC